MFVVFPTMNSVSHFIDCEAVVPRLKASLFMVLAGRTARRAPCPGQFMQQGQRSISFWMSSTRRTLPSRPRALRRPGKLSEAPWFVQAVSAFYSRKCRERTRERTDGTLRRPRPATEAEASVYRDVADEFADRSDCFLIAHLSDHR